MPSELVATLPLSPTTQNIDPFHTTALAAETVPQVVLRSPVWYDHVIPSELVATLPLAPTTQKIELFHAIPLAVVLPKTV